MSLKSGEDASPKDITQPASTANHDAEKASVENDDPDKEDTTVYPKGMKLFLIFFSLCSTTFLVALDATIIATALPVITSHFNSLNDYSWYNSAFFLTSCAFQLPFGRAYALLNTKWTFIVAILIFEVGSLVSATAPTSIALIIGRAIQGLGGAGIFGGAFIIIAATTPLRKRSLYAGSLGACFIIASVVGPILGGAFTTNVSWRWCFYINLPIGGLALTVVVFFLPTTIGKTSEELRGKTWSQILNRFNPVGTTMLVISIVCLLLALQWGGTQYPWNSARVIATFTVSGVLGVAWIILQIYQGEDAIVPGKLVCQRTVAAASLYSLLGSATFSIIVNYLPVWFQAIKQVNAEQSGIDILPLILPVAFFAVAGGGAVYIFGYYTPLLILGSVFCSVAAGLMYTLTPNSSTAEWVGYQILFAAGIGISLEQCNVAIQTVLPPAQIPIGISLTVFTRALGGSLAIPIGQNVFQQKLRKGLQHNLPTLDPNVVSGSGATDLITNVRNAVGGNETVVAIAVRVYNDAVARTFLVALIFAALMLPAALAVEWKSVKKEKAKEAEEEAGEGGKDAKATDQ